MLREWLPCGVGKLFPLLALSVALCGPGQALAEKPATIKLLPKETVVYFNVENAQNMAKKLSETSMGQMSRAPQLKPLVQELYGSVGQLWETAQEQIGLSLDEVWSLPQGEITVAVIAPEEDVPQVIMLWEAKDSLPTLKKLVARGLEEATKRGTIPEDETYQETKITILTPVAERRQNRPLCLFEKDGTLVVCTTVDLAKKLLDRWNGEAEESLSKNDAFISVMNRCQTADGERAQVTFFADPINLIRSIGQQNAQARVGLALLPTIGLDGLKGLGGSLTFATESFDSIMHAHLLLDNPRDGVIQVIALGTGDTTPERWVPANAAGYTTFYMEPKKSYRAITSLVDSFPALGDGFVDSRVQQFFDRLDLNFLEDVLPAMDGRISMTSVVQEPITITSQGTILGIKLKDPQVFTPALDRMVAKLGDRVEKQTFGNKPYYLVQVGRPRDEAEPEERPNRPRQPEPCFMILGDYLLVSDRPTLLQMAMTTESDASLTLSGSLEYKLISSRISRLAGTTKPSLVSFNRPEEGLHMLYELIGSEGARQGLRNQAENNNFFRSVNTALEKNPLPPFQVLKQYLAPGGSVMVDDETGIHFTTFTLKRAAD